MTCETQAGTWTSTTAFRLVYHYSDADELSRAHVAVGSHVSRGTHFPWTLRSLLRALERFFDFFFLPV